jgi:hypothetical protein
VTRHGRPVRQGWAALWGVPRMLNVPNAFVLRGRTTTPDAVVYTEMPLVDGSYVLSIPDPAKNWYLAIEEPGQAPTVVGPFPLKGDERKTLDVACAEGGSLRGRVKRAPREFAGQLWVVAFTKFGYRTEARVQPDGRFHLRDLPPGEYGLKVGHDAYRDTDTDVPFPKKPGTWSPEEAEAYNKAEAAPADPWKRAKVVQVEAGKECDGEELELP